MWHEGRGLCIAKSPHASWNILRYTLRRGAVTQWLGPAKQAEKKQKARLLIIPTTAYPLGL